MPKMTMVQALNLALKQEMGKDDRVILLGEDVGLDGGVVVLDKVRERVGLATRHGLAVLRRGMEACAYFFNFGDTETDPHACRIRVPLATRTRLAVFSRSVSMPSPLRAETGT